MFVRNAKSVFGRARIRPVAPAPPSHISAVCSDVAAVPGWDSVIDGGIDAGRGEMKRCAHVALQYPADS